MKLLRRLAAHLSMAPKGERSLLPIEGRTGRIIAMTMREHPTFSQPVSQLVTASQFFEPSFKRWALQELGWQFGFNRKLWEYAYILNALDIHGKLGGRGLGFGVGEEPTIPVMVRCGAKLVVTDLSPDAAEAKGWRAMNFDQASVETRAVDMNAIPADLSGFDFVWSCGSLEHIGGLERGLDFIKRAMACLRPGGVAVHTTEFNVSSDAHTIDWPELSLYRRPDLERLADQLRSAGHKVDLNLTPGTHVLDTIVSDDESPWEIRLKEVVAGFVATSVGLVVSAA